MTDGATLTYAQLQQLWITAGGNPQVAPMAAAIAMAESGGNDVTSKPNTNGTVDRGYWQINSVHGSQSSLDPMVNARAAVSISNNGTNWNPWTTFKTGAYRKFLGGASTQALPDNGIGGVGTGGSTIAAGISDVFDWQHIVDVIANWLLYSGLVMGGFGLMAVGGVLLFESTPAGKATTRAVAHAAKAAVFL